MCLEVVGAVRNKYKEQRQRKVDCTFEQDSLFDAVNIKGADSDVTKIAATLSLRAVQPKIECEIKPIKSDEVTEMGVPSGLWHIHEFEGVPVFTFCCRVKAAAQVCFQCNPRPCLSKL